METDSQSILSSGVPFDEAIEHFRAKVNMPTEKWSDLMGGMHSRAFVVAGAMKSELLSDLRSAVDKAIAQGTTIADFRRDFDGIVKKHGWSYKGSRNWRTSVIFNTNLRTAYQAGHYSQMTDPDVLLVRPFWRYVGILDGRIRPLHRSWHNTTLRHDNPWWKTHYPPNGWGCRCTVVSLSRAEVDALRDEGEKLNTDAPDDGVEERFIPMPNGMKKTVRVPRGIDPGWDYNVGETAWGRTQELRLMEDTGPWKALDEWGPEKYGLPAKLPLDIPRASLGPRINRGDEAGLREALKSALGSEEAVFTDPTGELVMVGQAVADHILMDPANRWDGREAYFPFIRELIEDPQEIWIGFAQSDTSGRVALRRRYFKMMKIGKNRTLGLYAEVQEGMWVAQDLFRGGVSGSKGLRVGRLLFSR